jgi:ubiquitin-conjugating enzyme E2 M
MLKIWSMKQQQQKNEAASGASKKKKVTAAQLRVQKGRPPATLPHEKANATEPQR